MISKLSSAKCVSGRDVLQPDQRCNVPGADRFHVDAFIGLNHHHRLTRSRRPCAGL